MPFTDWKLAFHRQKYHAKRRGISFNLSFTQWVMWWGPDIYKRGRGDGKLQMCRKDDEGSYEIGNIYKATCNKNSSDKFRNGKNGFRPGLTEAEVRRAEAMLKDGISQREVAYQFSVSQRTVNRINKGEHRPISSTK